MPSLVMARPLFVTNQAAPPDVAAHARPIIAVLAEQTFAAVEPQFTDQMTAGPCR